MASAHSRHDREVIECCRAQIRYGSLRPIACICAGPGSSNAARKHAEQQRILYQRGQQGGAFERVAPSKGESRRWERSGRFQKRVCGASPCPRPVFDSALFFPCFHLPVPHTHVLTEPLAVCLWKMLTYSCLLLVHFCRQLQSSLRIRARLQPARKISGGAQSL